MFNMTSLTMTTNFRTANHTRSLNHKFSRPFALGTIPCRPIAKFSSPSLSRGSLRRNIGRLFGNGSVPLSSSSSSSKHQLQRERGERGKKSKGLSIQSKTEIMSVCKFMETIMLLSPSQRHWYCLNTSQTEMILGYELLQSIIVMPFNSRYCLKVS